MAKKMTKRTPKKKRVLKAIHPSSKHGPDHGPPKHRGDHRSTITGKYYAGAKRSEDFSSAVARRKKKRLSAASKNKGGGKGQRNMK